MSKKQYDHIEARIREAAENSEPPFDEQAWAAMETRLNKEDKKLRFVYWWLALLILFITAGATIFFYNEPGKANHLAPLGDKNTAIIKQNPTVVNRAEQASAVTKDSFTRKEELLRKIITTKADSQPGGNLKATGAGKQPGTSIANTTNKGTKKSFSPPLVYYPPAETSIALNNKTKKLFGSKRQQITSTVTNGEVEEQGDIAITMAETGPDLITRQDAKPPVPRDSARLKDSLKNSIAKIETAGKQKQKANKPLLSRVYFMAVAGGEIGSVRLLAFKNNPVTPKFGVGIGYQISKKISVQTGFYAGTKKYVAGPGDYNAKTGSYWNMVQIVKVNAACVIYDIPLTLRYNFLRKTGVTYFATAGLSSYIMKKEDYDYYYIRNNMAHEGSYSYTGNKSAFSILNFSAGMEKKLSPSFSLQLEPTLSIPLSGVGDGRVKLFNAALQLGIKYKPFKK